ncbi:uncharacterized protein EI90DRAFT_2599163 [Cantharellus anzutake]|uniref:uncharacterized protein n=1 Tax=Cantharellus anzutake TaxID=1750568 RepID=UPI001907395F|nr:uncharacterized protein EI90DRAFT_2599163 [Cantharellus anzutake]KAF8320541.1 hypothetical protein EI90DRAFT_2599163 [Cantharellus anzutake]
MDEPDAAVVPGDDDSMSDSAMTEPALEADTSARTEDTSFSADLSCGICLDVLQRPYTVVPCLHTFDKECLVEWWKTNGTCPICKRRAHSGRFAFQLNGILQRYNKQKKHMGVVLGTTISRRLVLRRIRISYIPLAVHIARTWMTLSISTMKTSAMMNWKTSGLAP